VKGKSEAVTLYENFTSDSPERKALKLETKENFERAVRQFQAKQFKHALELFQTCQQVDPEDTSTRYYITLCESELNQASMESE